MAAVKASHEAYLNSIIQGYDDKIATVEAEQQAAIDKAVQKALTNSNTQIQKFEDMIGEQKRTVAKANGDINRLCKEIENLKASHASQIRNLQKQLQVGPNSWFEIHVTGKGRKKKTLVRRPSAPFNKAFQEPPRVGFTTLNMRFKHGKNEIQGRETKTRQQVCL